MSRLPITIAVGNYDRVRPLMDGRIDIDGVDANFLSLEPEEIFFRAFGHAEFDVCELSLSSFTVKQAAGNNRYYGIPVFPSRMFRHTAFYVRSDRGIERPEDLKGRRIGMPEYQLTACVWARIILADYGVQPSDINWVCGGLEEPGRVEKIPLKLPADVSLEHAPAGRTLSEMLEEGEIDGIIAPRAPKAFEEGDPRVRWLFSDPAAAATEYYERTQIFPIMHLLGIRKDLADREPWLPATLVKAFTKAKNEALDDLFDIAAQKVSLPFLEERARSSVKLMGRDFWPYGFDVNRSVLDAFLENHHAQGLSERRLKPEELFHPATIASFVI